MAPSFSLEVLFIVPCQEEEEAGEDVWEEES